MEEVINTNYEIMVIFSPDLGEENAKKELGEVKELLTSQAAKIIYEDVWGLRELAYTIKKHDQGYYVVLNFEMPPANLRELEKPLNLNQNVLRYLIVKTPAAYQFKTLGEYVAEAEKEAKEKKKDQEKEEESRKKVIKKPVTPTVKKTAPVETEKKPDKKVEKKPEANLEDVDKKLKSIIDDPDITL